jgi:hypothetical protein
VKVPRGVHNCLEGHRSLGLFNVGFKGRDNLLLLWLVELDYRLSIVPAVDCHGCGFVVYLLDWLLLLLLFLDFDLRNDFDCLPLFGWILKQTLTDARISDIQCINIPAFLIIHLCLNIGKSTACEFGSHCCRSVSIKV